jgi:uncharacterized cupredoxin-like copper-binding protein
MEHADPSQASVEPGGSADLIWEFSRSGRFDFACLQPGHFEAGMRGSVRVRAPAPGRRPVPSPHGADPARR